MLHINIIDFPKSLLAGYVLPLSTIESVFHFVIKRERKWEKNFYWIFTCNWEGGAMRFMLRRPSISIFVWKDEEVCICFNLFNKHFSVIKKFLNFFYILFYNEELSRSSSTFNDCLYGCLLLIAIWMSRSCYKYPYKHEKYSFEKCHAHNKGSRKRYGEWHWAHTRIDDDMSTRNSLASRKSLT